jgi:hypothetical protein
MSFANIGLRAILTYLLVEIDPIPMLTYESTFTVLFFAVKYDIRKEHRFQIAA